MANPKPKSSPEDAQSQAASTANLCIGILRSPSLGTRSMVDELIAERRDEAEKE